jgi:hypothetical protein
LFLLLPTAPVGLLLSALVVAWNPSKSNVIFDTQKCSSQMKRQGEMF